MRSRGGHQAIRHALQSSTFTRNCDTRRLVSDCRRVYQHWCPQKVGFWSHLWYARQRSDSSTLVSGSTSLQSSVLMYSYTDVGLQYGRAGGAQLPAPNRGWNWGKSEYPGRFAATLANYKEIRRAGGKFILLPHDLWGVDDRNSSYVWPGDGGNWSNYDAFLNQLISDLKANNMLGGLVWDIWNEADGYFWNGNRQQWLDLYLRTHKRLR